MTGLKKRERNPNIFRKSTFIPETQAETFLSVETKYTEINAKKEWTTDPDWNKDIIKMSAFLS